MTVIFLYMACIVNYNCIVTDDIFCICCSGIEQEWKLAQSSTEAASNGLFSATNELCIASRKAKSASGFVCFVVLNWSHPFIQVLHYMSSSLADELQSTILAMRDCAYEASIALSAYGRVSRGHTALTSECGSMLEEV